MFLLPLEVLYQIADQFGLIEVALMVVVVVLLLLAHITMLRNQEELLQMIQLIGQQARHKQ
jgi:cell division protein FtsL